MHQKIKAEPVFIASSYPEFLFSVIARLLLAAAIVYCFLDFDENPNVVGTVIVVLFILMMIFGHGQIWIYEDKIVEKSDSFVSLLFKWKHREILIKEIAKASLIPEQPVPLSEKIYLFILSFIFRNRPRKQTFHPVLFEMKNGETRYLITDTGLKQRKKIVEVVNELVGKNNKQKTSK